MPSAAYSGVHTSAAEWNPSAMTVSATLSTVTAIGSSRMLGICPAPLSIGTVSWVGSSPLTSATASSAAASASGRIAL